MKKTYVLVNGAFSGAWVWHDVVGKLEKKGHRAIAIELPAHGSDSTPAVQVSLQSYVDKVVSAVDAEPERVVLVGHSMGGVVISQAAEQRPQKIEKLVYVSAYLLANGQALNHISDADQTALLLPNLGISPDQTELLFNPAGAREVFLQGAPEPVVEQFLALLKGEPLIPLVTPISVTDAGRGSVPSVYISTLEDRALSPEMQRQLYTATPCGRIIEMATSHFPFLVRPEEFVAHLLSI